MVRTLLRNNERELFGATVTFELADGSLQTITRNGGTVKAVREACAIMVNRDEQARVVCVSTPQTIFTDLGLRRSGRFDGVPSPPEAQILRQAGFAALLHPRFGRYNAGEKSPR